MTYQKTLFVCSGNVGRSQIASSLYTKIKGEKSDSCGINVKESSIGKRLGDQGVLAEPVIKIMQNEGIDVSNNTRNKFTRDYFLNYERIIVLLKKTEIPGSLEYLLESPKVIFWEDIPDPKGEDDKFYSGLVHKIKQYIESMD